MKTPKKAAGKKKMPAIEETAVVREDSAVAMQEVGAFAAKTHLSSLLERVARGESFMITKHGKTVAQLTPAKPAPSKHTLGWAGGEGFWMSKDFDAPLEDFRDYM